MQLVWQAQRGGRRRFLAPFSKGIAQSTKPKRPERASSVVRRMFSYRKPPSLLEE